MVLPASGAPAPDALRGARAPGRHRASGRTAPSTSPSTARTPRTPGPARRRHAAPATPSSRSGALTVGAGVLATAVIASAGWASATTAAAQVVAVGRLVVGSTDAPEQTPAHTPVPGLPTSGALAPRTPDVLDRARPGAARVTARPAPAKARVTKRRAVHAVRLVRPPLPGWELGQQPPREVVRANVSVLAVVRRHFPRAQVGNAMAVVTCESSQQWWQRGHVNHDGTRDWGLFQLNDGGTLQGALRAIGVRFSTTRQAQALALNAEINTRAAIAIYRDRGWAPWVCAYTQGIVAALWSNTPGPMAGRYDIGGEPLPLTPPAPARPRPAPAPRPTPAPAPPPRRPSPAPTAPPAPSTSPTPSEPAQSPAPVPTDPAGASATTPPVAP